jgi:prevent-host-death family protein
MTITSRDIVPLSHARSHFSELADEVRAGAEKIVTRNGESYVALIAAERLDYYHRLEAQHGQQLVLEDVQRGLGDIAAGKVVSARASLKRIKVRRAKR